MNDDAKIKEFADMVDGVERLTSPMEKELERLHKQMFWERIVFGFIIVLLVAFAYLIPADMSQEQDFENSTQSQQYTEGATHGG